MASNAPFIDADRLCHEAETAGLAWCDAKAAADLLEETKKSVLASTIADYLTAGGAFNKAEQMALADDNYRAFLGRMIQACKARDRAKVKYDVLRTRIELLRTNASTERAAMSMR